MFDRPISIRTWMDQETVGAHLVVRATYLPNTVRCENRLKWRVPTYRGTPSEHRPLGRDQSIDTGLGLVVCFADVRANEYIVGTGPDELTVVLQEFPYWEASVPDPVVERRLLVLENVFTRGDYHDNTSWVPADGLEGVESFVFLGPATDHGLEAWQVYAFWDIERTDDGSIVAVHPNRDKWERSHPGQYTAEVEMSMDAFKTAARAAQKARMDEYDGRIGEASDLPDIVTDANAFNLYYTDVGAVNHPDGAPAAPPPACRKAVPDDRRNPLLVRDCKVLLSFEDTLRGTGTLNWSVDVAMADWEGITTGDGRVTHVKLANKGLTGVVPAELAALQALEELQLSGNSLTGCIPPALRDVPQHDLDRLGLPDCG